MCCHSNKDEKWNEKTAMESNREDGTPPSYPNEMMAKIFSSGYYSSNFSAIKKGQKVLDVGCGFGNNLTFFIDRGCDAYGVDINDEMVRLAKTNLNRLGRNAHIAVGRNDQIPFGNGEFDLLISVNTLHYQCGEEGIDNALNEFRRVTKEGGRIFIMTAGPAHEIRSKSKQLGPFMWEVLDYGFRTGSVLAFFEDREHLQAVLSKKFSSVETGMLTEKYSVRTLEFLYAICLNA